MKIYPTHEDVALVHTHLVEQTGKGLIVPHLQSGAGLFSWLPTIFKVAKAAIPKLLQGDVAGALAHGASAGISHVLTGKGLKKTAKQRRQESIMKAMKDMEMV